MRAQHAPPHRAGSDRERGPSQLGGGGMPSANYNAYAPPLTISVPVLASSGSVSAAIKHSEEKRPTSSARDGKNTLDSEHAGHEAPVYHYQQRSQLPIQNHSYGRENNQAYVPANNGDYYAPSATHDNSNRSDNPVPRTGESEEAQTSRPSSTSLRLAERKRLDQNSRGARLSYRAGSPLGLTVEVLHSRK
jgi:hypothetical protein